MFKRVFLFLAMNLAVIILINIVIAILERVFWINITGYWFNYVSIFIFALVVWFSWSFISLFLSKWLAKKAYWVEVVSLEDSYNLSDKEKVVFEIVKELAERNHINMPEVWFYHSDDPNAFATWATKNSSLVAVSSGLLNTMEKDEIEWVIGHEMAHILNWDMVTMTLLQWVLNTFVIFFARIVANIADNYFNKGENNWPSWIYYVVSIVMEIIFWILASFIAMWFSRYREYRADEWSANFLWKQKMIKALQALKRMKDIAPSDGSKMSAFQISTKKRSWIMALLSSHPDLDDRIKNLENLSI